MAVLHLNTDNFNQIVSSGKVMVDFWAPWCMPCQSLLPVIDELGEEAFAALCDLDVGDWIAVHGTMMRTKRGQLSVAVDSFELMSKSLRPLPEKFHGLTDKETRYRQRYVDLVMNPEVRTTFERRFKIASQFRVMSIPTVIFFVDGVEKERLIGVQPKQKYIDTLNNL